MTRSLILVYSRSFATKFRKKTFAKSLYLDIAMRVSSVFKEAIWAQRVGYMAGSDLVRSELIIEAI